MISRRKRHLFVASIFAWLMLSVFAVGVLTPALSGTAQDSRFMLAAPTIPSPSDMEFENGTQGEWINWNATDAEPKNYTVTRDGDVHLSGSWDGSEIAVNLNHLSSDELAHTLPVTFIFRCTVFNMQNESVYDEVQVRLIADESSPIIEAVMWGNETLVCNETLGAYQAFYEEGSFGHEITWNITESNPDTYNITRLSNYPIDNHTVVETGDWDGDNITLNVDGLNSTHWHLFTLYLNDTLGHNVTSLVNVTVYEDITAPVIDSPDDISYEFGAEPYSIEWAVYDSNPDNYTVIVTILYNDTSYGEGLAAHGPANITDGEWTFADPKGGDIIVQVHDLYLGNYTYTITLFDAFGRNATDSVNITVYRDLRAPVINATGDLTYEEGYTGNYLNWSAEETNPRVYNLTRDGEVIMNGTWSGQNLSLIIDGMDVGTFVYNMSFTDYFNQTSYVIITVQVTPDIHLPTATAIRVIQSYSLETWNDVEIQAFIWDLNGILNITLEWGTDPSNPEHSSMDSLGENLFIASLGEYPHGSVVWYRLTVQDNSSVQNIKSSGWSYFEVAPLESEGTPALLWVGFLILGSLATIVLFVIYFRTKTK